jgi:hypothetical protein
LQPETGKQKEKKQGKKRRPRKPHTTTIAEKPEAAEKGTKTSQTQARNPPASRNQRLHQHYKFEKKD